MLPPTFPSFFSTNFSTLKLRFPLLPSFSSPNIHSHRFWVIMMGRKEKTVNLGRKIKPLSTIKVGRETQSRVYTTGFFLGWWKEGTQFLGSERKHAMDGKIGFFTLFSAFFGYKNGKPQLEKRNDGFVWRGEQWVLPFFSLSSFSRITYYPLLFSRMQPEKN